MYIPGSSTNLALDKIDHSKLLLTIGYVVVYLFYKLMTNTREFLHFFSFFLSLCNFELKLFRIANTISTFIFTLFINIYVLALLRYSDHVLGTLQSDPIYYLARGPSDCYVSAHGLVFLFCFFLFFLVICGAHFAFCFFVKVLTLKKGEWTFFKLFEMLKFPINTHNILRVHSTQTGVHSIDFARIRIRLIMSHSLATVMLWHFLKLSSRIAEAAVQTQIDSIAVAIVSCKCLAYKVYKQRDMQHYAAVAAAFCLCTLIESTPMRALHHCFEGVTMMSFDPLSCRLRNLWQTGSRLAYEYSSTIGGCK